MSNFIISQVFVLNPILSDLASGGFRGACAHPPAQNCLSFMQFFATFGKIICCPPPGGLTTPLRRIVDPPLLAILCRLGL